MNIGFIPIYLDCFERGCCFANEPLEDCSSSGTSEHRGRTIRTAQASEHLIESLDSSSIAYFISSLV